MFEIYVVKSKVAATDFLSFTKVLGFEYVIAEWKGRTLTTFQNKICLEFPVFFLCQISGLGPKNRLFRIRILWPNL